VEPSHQQQKDIICGPRNVRDDRKNFSCARKLWPSEIPSHCERILESHHPVGLSSRVTCELNALQDFLKFSYNLSGHLAVFRSLLLYAWGIEGERLIHANVASHAHQREKPTPANGIHTQRKSVLPGIRNDVKVQGALTRQHFWQFSQSNSELMMSN
jgi:hypothetical protein